MPIHLQDFQFEIVKTNHLSILAADALKQYAAYRPFGFGQWREFDAPNVVFPTDEFDSVIISPPALPQQSYYARLGLPAGRKAADRNLLLRHQLALQANFPPVAADYRSTSPVEKLGAQAICPCNFYRDFEFHALTCTSSLCFHFHTGTHLDREIHCGPAVLPHSRTG